MVVCHGALGQTTHSPLRGKCKLYYTFEYIFVKYEVDTVNNIYSDLFVITQLCPRQMQLISLVAKKPKKSSLNLKTIVGVNLER